MFTRKELEAMSLFKLRAVARKMNVSDVSSLSQEQIMNLIEEKENKTQEVKTMFSREQLETLTYAQLSVIAQADGINATTKDEIIEALLKLEQDKQENVSVEESKEEAVKEEKPEKKTRGRKKVVKDKEEEEPQESNIETESKKIGEDTLNNKEEEKSVETPVVETETRCGVLDIHTEGYGFIRAENCEYGNKDAYVSAKLIKGIGLRPGDYISATVRKSNDNKQAAVISIETVNGNSVSTARQRPYFDSLVPIFPNERFVLEDKDNPDNALRCIDLIAPIGKGQRAMIVSPPKAGKTTLLKKIANAISKKYPDVELYVLLIDERPEEVTDMQRSIKGEVIYSTFDETPEHHCKAAELLNERAKRSVELGRDVVIIMDSLTRLARAYNLTVPPTGRTLSGGMDPGALHPPKKFFGSARNIENGGSLTIIATALVDTGSRMDDVIYEEFKGTGNMEIHLDRKLSEKRIFPAIDLNRSSTRREDLLLTQKEQVGATNMRRLLSAGDSNEAIEQLLNWLYNTKTNNDFIDVLQRRVDAFEKNGYNFRNPTNLN